MKEGKIKRPKKNATSDTPHYENVPFEVPSGWCWTTLGRIGTWQSGSTPSRHRNDYYNGNIPWLKTGDLNDGYITQIPEYITQKALEETSVKLNPEGSVLIAMYGATIGKVGILTFPATTNQACCACSEYEGIEAKYLFYFLLSHKEAFIMQGMGGAQPNISKEKIVETQIPLPPLAEQQRIIDEIEKYFSIISLIEEENICIEQLIAQSKSKILDLAIRGKLVEQDPDDEPSSELLKHINPNWEPSDTSHYKNVPKGWCLTKLPEVANVFYGFPFDSSKFNQEGKGTPLIRIRDVVPAQTTTYTTESAPQDYIIHIGDMLVGMDGNFNVSYWRSSDAYLNQRVCKITANEDLILKDYLYYYLPIALNDIENNVSFMTVKHLSDRALKNIPIPLPPYNEQIRIVEKIQCIFSALDSISQSLTD